jgi:DNA-binding CsgD family transcriptional regulator
MKVLETFFEETNELATRPQAMQAFLRLGHDSGFDMGCFLELQTDFNRHELSRMPMVADFPEDFLEHYFTKNLLTIDPVVDRAFQRPLPYRWREVGAIKELTDAERYYLTHLDDAGITDGVAVPLFGPRGSIGFAGFGVKGGKLDITREEMLILQHKAFHLYNLYMDMGAEIIPPMLSPREREVLSWIAAGKSNSVIADILGISDHTVDSLLRRAYRKLNVTARAAAVARAVQWGLISLP